MRLATYNVEWFDKLFDDQDRLKNDNEWSARHNVTRAAQIAALGTVLKALDADAILVVEAPASTGGRASTKALSNFAAHAKLRTSAAIGGFANDTQQEIALLYDPGKLSARHDPRGLRAQGAPTTLAPPFDSQFRADLAGDTGPTSIRFSKPPLEVEMIPTGKTPIRLIGVHAKSKAPHGARNLKQQIQISLANRRKQLAQCLWLRERINEHMNAAEPLIVLGDLNDGPGLDDYEKMFGHSGVEIVLGKNLPDAQRLYDPHAALAQSPRPGALPTTARFYNQGENRFLNALLDYIMVSSDLRQKAVNWRIWHPFNDKDCFADTDLRNALLTASDHFPVTLDIAL